MTRPAGTSPTSTLRATTSTRGAAPQRDCADSSSTRPRPLTNATSIFRAARSSSPDPRHVGTAALRPTAATGHGKRPTQSCAMADGRRRQPREIGPRNHAPRIARPHAAAYHGDSAASGRLSQIRHSIHSRTPITTPRPADFVRICSAHSAILHNRSTRWGHGAPLV